VDAVEVGFLAARREGVGRHHETRRAEAALSGIGFGHGRLHGMRRAARAVQALDGTHGPAVDLSQQGDAGIHRRAPAVGALQHDGAGAAIALGTALLGAPEPPMLAQPVEQRRHRRRAVELDRLVVEDKTYAVRHANDCDRGVLYSQAVALPTGA
jgi:hypothetical protein